jgi:hypothetical protein
VTSSANGTTRTWQTPRGQFLDHLDVQAKAQQVVEGGIAGTGKKHDSTAVARGVVEVLFGETQDSSGVHVQTVLATLGALAGFAVQMGIREELVKSGKVAIEKAFVTVTAKDGSLYYFGDLLNEGLVASRQGQVSVWGLVAGAARNLGAKALPDIRDTFAHVSHTVGGQQFGVPRLPLQLMPRLTPFQLLDKFWNPVRNYLAISVSTPMLWPFVLAHAAQLVMQQAAKVIEPALATEVIMEAAIPMSRVDPRQVYAAYFWPTDC